MFKRSFVAVAVLATICVPLFSAQSPKPSPSNDLPPGAMQAKTHTACTACHDNRIITQQRLSKAAWGKEVDKMVLWGTIRVAVAVPSAVAESFNPMCLTFPLASRVPSQLPAKSADNALLVGGTLTFASPFRVS